VWCVGRTPCPDRIRSDELEARGVVGVPGAADVGAALTPDEDAEPEDGGGGEGAQHHAGLAAAVHLPMLLLLRLSATDAGGGVRRLDLVGGRGRRGGLAVVVALVFVGGGRVRGRVGGGGCHGGGLGRRQ